MWWKEKREESNQKSTNRKDSLGTDTQSGTSLSSDFFFFFFRYPAGLFVNVVWSLWLFRTVGVAVVWDGCHHAAGKTGGEAAVPASENSQAEGKITLISGDG